MDLQDRISAIADECPSLTAKEHRFLAKLQERLERVERAAFNVDTWAKGQIIAEYRRQRRVRWWQFWRWFG